jgi:hypothetical protein
MEKRTRFHLSYLLFALLGIWLAQAWWRAAQTVEIIPYSRFEAMLEEDRIERVTVGDTHLTGKLRRPEGGKSTVAANRVEPVEGAWEKALLILAKDKALLLRGAELLLQRETLAEAELAELRASSALRAA